MVEKEWSAPLSSALKIWVRIPLATEFFLLCLEKTNINEKEAEVGQFFKKGEGAA